MRRDDLRTAFCPFLFLPQNFKREEQNFVVQNEINNLSFLTGDNKSKMSKVGSASARSPQRRQQPFLLCPSAANTFINVWRLRNF